jgi:hypothetical protein
MLKLLTRGNLLTHLKEAIINTGESIFIVGPWLDAYFIRLIINSISNKDVEVKFIVRIDDGVIDTKTMSALNLARQNLNNFKAKSLENLHSKVILIDNEIFFLGSANWYWYSLNLGVEVTINGTTDQLPELIPELEKYWDEGAPIPDDLISKFQDFEPIRDLRC